ncbi:fibroleukin-like [Saccostrea cucullata]|uniref:fibroleukin-like n=1 Tax=Saccostrea cuccullata TaxID=36930 RepID=UPI002ED05D27
MSQATIFLQRYTADLDLNNKKSNNELLGENEAHSKTRCAAMCQKECSGFGYNSVMKKCRTHKKIFTSNTSDEAGWRYFFNDSVYLPIYMYLQCQSFDSFSSISVPPIDCKDFRDNGHTNTGVYEIYPFGTTSHPLRVYCDMDTLAGGWTAIQKRIDGSLTFDKNWDDYKNGFGAPEQNVWIGNDVIHQLTMGKNSSLYVSITLSNGSTLYELYDQFSISDEADKYQLFLSGPVTGTLGDSMLNTSNTKANLSGMYFSTPDRDNDKWTGVNCAALSIVRGGWWFNACHFAFLNGQWYPEYWDDPWDPAIPIGTSVRKTIMMIRSH